MRDASFQLRRANLDDLRSVEAIVQAAGLPLAGLADHFPSMYWVADVRTQVVGTVGLERHGNYALLRSLAVSRDHKSRGIGRALVATALDAARADGVAGVYLLTNTAQTYFPDLGFFRVERASAPPELQVAPEFASICPSSASCLAWQPPHASRSA